MKNYLSNLDGKILKILHRIGKEADRRQMPAYVVGGFVRDAILSRSNHDLDISVEGDAILLSEVLAKKWKTQRTVHKQFGTACLKLPQGIRVDLAKARKEHYKHPGALPTVQAGNLEEDLFRRDFTINAMAIVINSNHFGHLVNKFQGLEDLSAKKIRVLHERSFIDDPTRILRAVRFAQRFNFQIERKTLTLMKSALQRKVEENVKRPRYFNEFKKILSERDPLSSLKKLHSMGGLRFIDPQLTFQFQGLKRIHDGIQKAKDNPIYRAYNGWWLVYFIALIAKEDDRVITRIVEQFSLTRNEKISIQQSRKTDEFLKKVSKKSLRASRIYEILKPLTQEVILYLYLRAPKAFVRRRIDRFLWEDMNVQLHVGGNDLKEMGITSGQVIGQILKHILYLKIDQQVHTKKEELNKALDYMKSGEA